MREYTITVQVLVLSLSTTECDPERGGLWHREDSESIDIGRKKRTATAGIMGAHGIWRA